MKTSNFVKVMDISFPKFYLLVGPKWDIIAIG
jgi:hypothetical protein